MKPLHLVLLLSLFTFLAACGSNPTQPDEPAATPTVTKNTESAATLSEKTQVQPDAASQPTTTSNDVVITDEDETVTAGNTDSDTTNASPAAPKPKAQLPPALLALRDDSDSDDDNKAVLRASLEQVIANDNAGLNGDKAKQIEEIFAQPQSSPTTTATTTLKQAEEAAIRQAQARVAAIRRQRELEAEREQARERRTQTAREKALILARQQREARERLAQQQQSTTTAKTEKDKSVDSTSQTTELTQAELEEAEKRRKRAAANRARAQRLAQQQRELLKKQKAARQALAKQWENQGNATAKTSTNAPAEDVTIVDGTAVTFEGLTTYKTTRGLLVRLGNPFNSNSTNLTNQALITLNSLATHLKQRSDYKVLIEAHSDNRGGNAYALGLSERYANEIRYALIKRGIPSNRLQSKGYGSKKPLLAQANEERNRRVELVLYH